MESSIGHCIIKLCGILLTGIKFCGILLTCILMSDKVQSGIMLCGIQLTDI
jgi:hypothetical protein